MADDGDVAAIDSVAADGDAVVVITVAAVCGMVPKTVMMLLLPLLQLMVLMGPSGPSFPSFFSGVPDSSHALSGYTPYRSLGWMSLRNVLLHHAHVLIPRVALDISGSY